MERHVEKPCLSCLRQCLQRLDQDPSYQAEDCRLRCIGSLVPRKAKRRCGFAEIAEFTRESLCSSLPRLAEALETEKVELVATFRSSVRLAQIYEGFPGLFYFVKKRPV